MKPKQTPKPYQPTEKEVSAVLDLQNFYDWLQIQHECESYESDLTKTQLIKQRNAVRNAYKGALMIEKALKDFQFC
jgi:hypothetical protein